MGCSKYDWEKCVECQSPFQLHPQEYTCYLPYCSAYSWSGCTQCQQGYLLCQGTCRPVIPHCLSHNDQGQCLTCESGFILSQGICLKNIPFCQKWSADGLSCQQCNQGYQLLQGLCLIVVPHCQQQDQKGCTCCEIGYHLNNSQCVANDANCLKYTNVQDGWEQCSQCQQGYYYSSLQEKCLPQQPGCVYMGCDCVGCSKPFLHNSSNNTCYLPGCQKYSNQGCLSCLSPFQLNNSVCAIDHCLAYDQNSCTKCDLNFILINSGVCVLRDPYCLKYQGTQCCQCQQGWILKQGSCVVQDENCVKYGQNGLICTDCNQGYHPDSQGRCVQNLQGCIYSQGLCQNCKPPFQHTDQNTCLIPHCQSLCSSGCTQCQNPYILTPDGTCQLQHCLR